MYRNLFLLAALLTLACGETHTFDEEYAEYTGIIQVLAPGSRSETVVLEDMQTGMRYALVGDNSRELVRLYGSTVTVTAVPTEEGWSVRPEFQKLEVVEYILLEPDYGREE